MSNEEDLTEHFMGQLHDEGILDIVGISEKGNALYNLKDLDALYERYPYLYKMYYDVYVYMFCNSIVHGNLTWEVKSLDPLDGKFQLTEHGKTQFKDENECVEFYLKKVMDEMGLPQ